MTSFGHALRAIIAIVASQLAFLLNDTLIKLASTTLPMGEIIFLRGFFCAAFIGAVVVATGLHRKLRLLYNGMVFWRALGELGGTIFYLIALFNMPIANATIIFQAVPLSATAGAALFLGERVGWRRWLAIVIGFVGVVMVVRPGLDGFDAFGLLVLVSVLFVSLRDLTTIAMPIAMPALLIALSSALIVAAMGAALGLTEQWVLPGWLHLLQLAGAGFLIAIGYFTAIAAMQLGDMSMTAPFRYVAVVFAIAIGYLVWGEVPDAMTFIGSGVIVAAGLYTLYRENKTKGSGAVLTAAPTAVPPQT